MLSAKTILVPTDFSESCDEAFRLASTLARDQGGRLIVLHVAPKFTRVGAYGEPSLQLNSKEHKAKLQRELRRFQAADPRVRVDHQLVEGDPATEILRIAKEVNSDLILMGLHGRTGMERVLTGSVIERVMRDVPCEVLLVKIAQPCYANPSLDDDHAFTPSRVGGVPTSGTAR